MKLKVYSVFDSKVEAFMTPFFMRADGEAVRACIQASRDASHNFSKHSADYTLFRVGEFDDGNGRVIALDTFVNLGNILALASSDRGPNMEVAGDG